MWDSIFQNVQHTGAANCHRLAVTSENPAPSGRRAGPLSSSVENAEGYTYRRSSQAEGRSQCLSLK